MAGLAAIALILSAAAVLMPAAATAAPIAPTSLRIATLDETGKPLVGTTFGGTFCTTEAGDTTCEDLSAYPMTSMGHASYTDAPGRELFIQDSSATSCADSTQFLTLNEVAAPKGYALISGNLELCYTSTGWQVASDTTSGAISLDNEGLVSTVVFRHVPGSPSGTTPERPSSRFPSVAKVDEQGNPLRGMVFDGESCRRATNGNDWFCEDLSNYDWTDMTYRSETDAPSRDVTVSDTTATSCADTLQKVRLWEDTSPAGYTRAPGEIVLCQVVNGWIVETNTTGGAVTYDQPSNTVVFADQRGTASSLGANKSSNTLTVVKTDQNGAPLIGMVYGGETCSRGTTDDSWNCEDLGNYTFTDMRYRWEDHSINDELPLTRSGDGTCATALNRLVLREVTPPAGYETAPGEIELCLSSHGWVEGTNTSQGAITFDQSHQGVIFSDARVAVPVVTPTAPETPAPTPTPTASETPAATPTPTASETPAATPAPTTAATSLPSPSPAASASGSLAHTGAPISLTLLAATATTAIGGALLLQLQRRQH